MSGRMAKMNYLNNLFGANIVITSREYQVRKHHKRRINKKWLKRYGTITYEIQKDTDIYSIGNTIYVTKKGYEFLRSISDECRDKVTGGNRL